MKITKVIPGIFRGFHGNYWTVETNEPIKSLEYIAPQQVASSIRTLGLKEGQAVTLAYIVDHRSGLWYITKESAPVLVQHKCCGAYGYEGPHQCAKPVHGGHE